jgi:hypothetical protein
MRVLNRLFGISDPHGRTLKRIRHELKTYERDLHSDVGPHVALAVGDDIAVADLRQIIVTDADSPTVYHWNASNNGLADQFQIDTYPNVRNFLDNLTANDDLAGDNASFGPADFTAAYQYNFSIIAGESYGSGVGSISPVPEPSTALLLMVGLATIARRRRAQKA